MSRSAEQTTVPEITALQLKERLDREDGVLLVDVREPFEKNIADLPEVGQVRIPVGSFQGSHRELDPERDIVVYCRSGSRSEWAVGQLRARGYENVWNLKGGILAWRDDVDPTLTAY